MDKGYLKQKFDEQETRFIGCRKEVDVYIIQEANIVVKRIVGFEGRNL